ncbi:MAG: alkaline phosphatase D family protein, partial [Bacteroidia bacterium]|nr:alkaline phosphatase D family protein [Bacteroidia bacterium]
VFGEIPFPPSARRNAISAYTRLFPHYDLVDTVEGLYHKIRFGNVEIFMCDNRSSRSPSLNCFRDSAGVWVYQNPPNHSILGQTQMNRLLNDLKNSTATWKFVMTGVSFNIGYNRAMDALSGNANQDLDLSAFSNQVPPGTNLRSIMGALADTWAGYREDQQRLLDHLQTHNLKNVVFLSSDSHTGAIDDGTNAGLPELMAGSLGTENSRLAWIMDTVGKLPPQFLNILGLNSINLSIWNHGGNGLGNGYFGPAFGWIEVFGEDSCRLSLVDTTGKTFASLTLCKDVGNCRPASSRTVVAPAEKFELYPNPARNEIRLRLDSSVALHRDACVAVYDALGKRVKLTTRYDGQPISIDDLAPGTYHLMLKNGPQAWVKSFQKR